MTYRIALTALFAGFLATSAFADQVRLPPSVGATPIEIPGKAIVGGIGTGRTSATPIEIPGAGRTSATPIEIPGKAQPVPGAVAVLPIPLPGPQAARFDPRADPSRFAVLPLPLPRVASTGKMGRFTYAALPDGTVYGDTNYGYTLFADMNAYRAFLDGH